MYTSAVDTTTTISSVCPKCGTVHKSGKASCCGRGGSWFKSCGGASSNTKLHHTWYDGIQACKARSHSKSTIGPPVNAAQSKTNESSNLANSKKFSTAVNTFKLTPVNTLPPTLDITLIITPANTLAFTLANSLMTDPAHTASALASMTNSSSVMLMNTPVMML